MRCECKSRAARQAVLRIIFFGYFTGYGNDTGNDTGCDGFSYGLSVGLSGGHKETVDFFREVAYYNLSQINAGRVHVEQNEKPRSCRSGVFLALYGELFRLGCCCLFISIQPLAYVVANHTCCDRDNKRWNNIVHAESPPFCWRYGSKIIISQRFVAFHHFFDK